MCSRSFLWRQNRVAKITQLLQNVEKVAVKLEMPSSEYKGCHSPNQGNRVSTSVTILPNRQKPNWFTSIILTLFHIGAAAALFMFSWRAFIVTAVLYWLTVGLGISMGYHRLLTHRSYRVPLPLEYFFAICGALTLEGG